METKTRAKPGSAVKINLIWVGVGFGVFYWVLESVRDVLAFGKGTLFQRLFYPDLASVWMRLMIICMIVFYGFYAQSLRSNLEETGTFKKGSQVRIILSGLVFASLYWFLEAARDVFIFKKGRLIDQLVSPDIAGLSVRLLAVSVLFLFSIYVQNMINERRAAEESDKRLREELEKMVDQRAGELKRANERLQLEVEGCRRLETALWVSRKAFHDILDATSDGILVVDESKRIKFANLAFEKMLGRNKAELEGEVFDFPLSSGYFGRLSIDCAKGPAEVDMRVSETEWQETRAYLVVLNPVHEVFPEWR